MQEAKEQSEAALKQTEEASKALHETRTALSQAKAEIIRLERNNPQVARDVSRIRQRLDNSATQVGNIQSTIDTSRSAQTKALESQADILRSIQTKRAVP